jgi:hypothetical protein
MREERVDVRGRVRADAKEHVAQMVGPAHAVRLTRRDDRVEDRLAAFSATGSRVPRIM